MFNELHCCNIPMYNRHCSIFNWLVITLVVYGWFFNPNYGKFSHTRWKIIILCQVDLCKVRLNPHKVRLKQNIGKLKIPVLMEVTFAGHLDHLSCCQLSWKAVITKNHKNDYHDSTIQNSNLQQKPNNTKFGSVFKVNMLVSKKSAAMTLLFNINQGPRSLGQSTAICHQPSQMITQAFQLPWIGILVTPHPMNRHTTYPQKAYQLYWTGTPVTLT